MPPRSDHPVRLAGAATRNPADDPARDRTLMAANPADGQARGRDVAATRNPADELPAAADRLETFVIPGVVFENTGGNLMGET